MIYIHILTVDLGIKSDCLSIHIDVFLIDGAKASKYPFSLGAFLGDSMATIQGIYVALFGRPADPTGLTYFNGVTKNGADLTAIGDLASTAEYKERFAGQTNSRSSIQFISRFSIAMPKQTASSFLSMD